MLVARIILCINNQSYRISVSPFIHADLQNLNIPVKDIHAQIIKSRYNLIQCIIQKQYHLLTSAITVINISMLYYF